MAPVKICAVIPTYNEADKIGGVVARALAQVPAVLVVDDGSRDETAGRARAAGAVVLARGYNLGKGASLAEGLDWAAANGYEAAVTLDGDGQHMPEEIGRLVAAGEAADLVVGNRMADCRDMPFVRWVTNRVMSRIISWLARAEIPDSQCGFRLIRTAGWKRLNVLSRNFDFESEILVAAGRGGLRVAHAPISTVYADEVSKINPVTDTIRFIRLVWRLLRTGGQKQPAAVVEKR